VNTLIIPFFSVEGTGDTWEEAFTAAERREKVTR
jgi:hypothetical protein